MPPFWRRLMSTRARVFVEWPRRDPAPRLIAILLKRLHGLAKDIHDLVDLGIARDERRSQTIDVAANAAIQPALAAFFVQPLSHLLRGIESFLRLLVSHKFETNQHTHAAHISHEVKREELLHTLQKSPS